MSERRRESDHGKTAETTCHSATTGTSWGDGEAGGGLPCGPKLLFISGVGRRIGIEADERFNRDVAPS